MEANTLSHVQMEVHGGGKMLTTMSHALSCDTCQSILFNLNTHTNMSCVLFLKENEFTSLSYEKAWA